jgi:hypothetical protein
MVSHSNLLGESMKISRTYISFIISIILIVSVGCTPAKLHVTIKIPSLRQYYPMLLKEAQKWRSDAYLDEARIFLFPYSSDSYVISTGFYSPSENLESLGVYFYQDGTITSEVFTHGYPINHHNPITLDDWVIDSQQALEYMLDADGNQFVKSDRKDCSNITLARLLPAQNQPIIWSLSLWDCSDSMKHLYLDANSGELLDSSVINIQPTRFPTHSP